LRVALTFDTEHPSRPCSGRSLERILASLAEDGVRATFFIQGRWASAFPEAAGAIADAGHLIANHSHHHAPMSALTEDGFREDVTDAAETIRQITGVDPRPWFRCPFGAGKDDPRVLGLLEELGYRHVGWDVDPRDWDGANAGPDVSASVLGGLEQAEESIVLLHSWPDATAEALPEILGALRSSSAELVDVAALLG
jgi:peptidoglycan/xylan/chitin deacetylase (PgdA/CDA1 family)